MRWGQAVIKARRAGGFVSWEKLTSEFEPAPSSLTDQRAASERGVLPVGNVFPLMAQELEPSPRFKTTAIRSTGSPFGRQHARFRRKCRVAVRQQTHFEDCLRGV